MNQKAIDALVNWDVPESCAVTPDFVSIVISNDSFESDEQLFKEIETLCGCHLLIEADEEILETTCFIVSEL